MLVGTTLSSKTEEGSPSKILRYAQLLAHIATPTATISIKLQCCERKRRTGPDIVGRPSGAQVGGLGMSICFGFCSTASASATDQMFRKDAGWHRTVL
eukprot:CAMPEP_0204247090 /NCGR_PEP_ID=MMETSP0361-20130328/98473_1 /ASSEMBLY_ACC=CAM_ASM_000343 /TAXON_ID=268821 /ORGANISM="Scrippsiella Hangoei, Strain SHTV-5" /LENGTH=97 /DNA_ID=CAMNT_0051220321 /DNA_START=184 /DNA_END=477 /DNA_ORIENTATION=+